MQDIQWPEFDIENIYGGDWMTDPYLSKAKEIGFTDLHGGNGSPSSSRLDWIKVYGEPIEINKN